MSLRYWPLMLVCLVPILVVLYKAFTFKGPGEPEDYEPCPFGLPDCEICELAR